MRTLLLFLVLCGSCLATCTAPCVAHVAAAASSPTASITTASIDTSGANLLVVSLTIAAGHPLPTLSDSYGNTWKQIFGFGATDIENYYFYATQATVGTDHTFHLAVSGAASAAVAVAAFSNVESSPLDGPFALGVASGTYVAANLLVSSQNGDLIIASIGFDVASTLLDVRGSAVYNITDRLDPTASSSGLAIAYLKQPAISYELVSCTFTNSQYGALVIPQPFKTVAAPVVGALRRILN
jgi:hypothetical protein